jgi:hypothetical protein
MKTKGRARIVKQQTAYLLQWDYFDSDLYGSYSEGGVSNRWRACALLVAAAAIVLVVAFTMYGLASAAGEVDTPSLRISSTGDASTGEGTSVSALDEATATMRAGALTTPSLADDLLWEVMAGLLAKEA